MGKPAAICPRCGEKGRAVADTTVELLVSGEHRASLTGAAMFCATPSCEVVYFKPEAVAVTKAAVRVPVFQKETDPSRPVCYCFDHSVRAVLDAARPDGSNTVVDSITEACRAGLDRCEETNPQGRCCLGNVRAVAKTAPEPGACPSCCGGGSE